MDCDLPTQVLSSWFTQIGDRGPLVQTMHIDMDSLCSVDCKTQIWSLRKQNHVLRYYRRKLRDFDVGGLTEFIWLHKLQANVKMVRIIMAPHDNCLQEYTRFQVSEPFSEFLEAIYMDELGLKKYRRMIGAIALRESNPHGSLLFWTTSEHEHAPHMARHVCPDTALSFSRTKYVTTNQSGGPKSCFAGLPKHLQKNFSSISTLTLLSSLLI
jgi:hypothetical protein